jgi:hypothetical protein
MGSPSGEEELRFAGYITVSAPSGEKLKRGAKGGRARRAAGAPGVSADVLGAGGGPHARYRCAGAHVERMASMVAEPVAISAAYGGAAS